MSDLKTHLVNMPPEKRLYALREVCNHLLTAQQFQRLEQLLTDIFFLEAKTETGMVFALAADFSNAVAAMTDERPQRRILRLLEKAIRRDIQFIARHAKDYPQALFQCLWNTCWWYDCPGTTKHYVERATGLPAHELSLGRRGPRLSELLERWYCARESVFQGFHWLRSLRPPFAHLGSAEEAVLVGHEETVASVAFSADGRQIVSGSWDKTVRVWDADRGDELHCLRGHEEWVSSVAYGPDGRRVVSGSNDNTLRVWDAELGTELQCLRGHENWVTGVAYRFDGRRIVSGSWDKTVRVWDADSGTELQCLGGDDAVNSVAYRSDGQRIVSGVDDSTVRVWDADCGAELLCLRGHVHQVTSVAYSPDGSRIVSGSVDRTVRVWDADSGVELHCLRGHNGGVASVAYSPDGRRVISGSSDNTVRVWDAEGGAELHCFRVHEGYLSSVAYSPDGGRIASGGNDMKVRVLDVESEADPYVERFCLYGHLRPIASVAYSPDGRRIVTGAHDHLAQVWDTESGTQICFLSGHEDRVASVAYSPDSRRIVSGSYDGTVRVWDADWGTELRCLRWHESRVSSVAYSPDGRRIVSGSYDGTVRVWDAESGERFSGARGHESVVSCVAYSPDSQHIVSGSWDKTVRVWDGESGTEVLCLRGHEQSVVGVAYCPDGKRVVSRSGDDEVRIWDVESGQCVEIIESGCDVAGIAASGSGGLRWRVLVPGQEMVIESGAGGEGITWFPAEFDRIAPHPTDPTWVGAAYNQFYILTLEGGEPTANTPPYLLDRLGIVPEPLNSDYSVPPRDETPTQAAGLAAPMNGNGTGYLQIVTNSVGMKLVLIPPGDFLMGSPESKTDLRQDEFQHLVRITKPFYLGVYTVTQSEFERVMNTNPSRFTSGGNLPVEQVSWAEAMIFFQRLSDLPEEKTAGRFYRLPTEAEWEYACRAGTTTRWYCGDNQSDLAKAAWFDDNSEGQTHPVGQKEPNAWGLYDMHGNVWEWCNDWYGEDYYKQPTKDDPQGPTNTGYRVNRGGSWFVGTEFCRSAIRAAFPPECRDDTLGFRVVAVLSEGQPSTS